MNDAVAKLLAGTRVRLRRGPYLLGAWPLAMESAVHAGVIRTQRDVEIAGRIGAAVCAIAPQPQVHHGPGFQGAEVGQTAHSRRAPWGMRAHFVRISLPARVMRRV